MVNSLKQLTSFCLISTKDRLPMADSTYQERFSRALLRLPPLNAWADLRAVKDASSHPRWFDDSGHRTDQFRHMAHNDL
jgi:hypothetical protein